MGCGRASAGCGGIHRSLRFPPRLISTHFPPPVYITQLQLHLPPLPPTATDTTTGTTAAPLPLLISPSTHSAAITAASPRSRPGWLHLHSRRRSRGSSQPSPSSTPAGDLSASTKVGSFPLSAPPLSRSVHELIFLLFRPDALAFAIPCFPVVSRLIHSD